MTIKPDGQLWVSDSLNLVDNSVSVDDLLTSQTGDTSPPEDTTSLPKLSGGSGPSSYEDIAVGTDTVANLYFGLTTTGILYSANLATGAFISSQQVADTSEAQGDEINTLAVDPLNHVVYISLFGGPVSGSDRATNEILAVSYNPATGAISTPEYNASTHTQSGSTDTLISSASDPSFNQAQDFALDTATNTLYYVSDIGVIYTDKGTPAFTYGLTNGIYSVSTTSTNQTAKLLTTTAQFPTETNPNTTSEAISSPNGLIVSLAVDAADGLIYFTTVPGTGGKEALWYMPIGGGTATQLTPPSGIVFGELGATETSFGASSELVFDPTARVLYLADLDPGGTTSNPESNGAIYQLALGAGGTSIASGSVFYSFPTTGYIADYATGLSFDALPTIGALTQTTTEALQGGAGVTALGATPTGVTDPTTGGYLASATVTISNPQTGDLLGIGSNFSLSNTAVTTSNGGSFVATYNAATATLTILNASGVENTFAQFETILSQVAYKDTGTDTSSGAHPTRALTWQVNNGTAGNPAGSNNVATTTITIDRPPTVTNETVGVATAIGGTISVAASSSQGLLASGQAQDLDGDTLTVTAVSVVGGATGTVGSPLVGAHGTLTLNANGSFTYLLSNTTGLTDAFDYTVSDGNGGTTNGVLTLQLPPVIQTVASSAASGAVVASGQTVTFTLDLSEKATVSGTPFLTLSNGDHAAYSGGSGSAALTFAYTVGSSSSENSTDLQVSSLNLNGGSITDNLGSSLIGSAAFNGNFTVDAVAPTISVTGTTTDAVQGGGALTVLASSPTLTDSDSLQLQSASVSISGGFKPGDVLSATTGATGITAAYNSATGVLSLTGAASVATYAQVLDSVVYTDTGTDTSSGAHPTRTLSWTVSDGYLTSSPVTTTITIDRPPTVTNETVSVATTIGGTISVAATSSQGLLASGQVTDLDGDALTVTAVSVVGGATGTVGSPLVGAHGTLTLNANGSFTYLLSNASGSTDAFNYTVSDGKGGATNGVLTLQLPPSVASITSSPTSGSAVGPGGKVTFTVTFTENVSVNTAGGAPQLVLNNSAVATYSSGTGTNQLTFVYTVGSGASESTSDLQVQSLSLAGATIVNNLNASVVGGASEDTGLIVDTIAPTLTITSATPGGPTYSAAQTIAGTIDVADANRTISIYDGSTLLGTTTANAQGDWIYNATLPHRDGNVITAQATNVAGVPGTSASINILYESAPDDFYGADVSDILWQSTGGTVIDWQIVNGQFLSAETIAGFAPGSGWSVVGTGDFTGSGVSDVLLEYVGGGEESFAFWDVQNGTYAGYTPLSGFPTTSGWAVLGTGDFTGTGTDDVLLGLTTGGDTYLFDWQISNGAVVATNNLNMGFSTTSGWEVLGTGDFYGDGVSDVLFENTNSGTVADWRVQNDTASTFSVIAGVAPGSGWVYDGVGDFNGDGTSDVLWQNGAALAIWEIQNGKLLQSVTVTTPAPTGYVFEGIGDYTGNLTSDILWQNPTTGSTLIWEMQSGQVAATSQPGALSPGTWQIVK